MSKSHESKGHSHDKVIHAIEASAATMALASAVTIYWMRQHHDAEDAAQNAYLKAFRGAGRFLGDSEVSTWLHRIGVNAAKDMLEKKSHDPATGLRVADDEAILGFIDADEATDPVSSFLLQESNGRVKELLATLPEPQRKAVGFELLGFSDAEISEMTGMPIGTIKAYRHRGRVAIRKRLELEAE